MSIKGIEGFEGFGTTTGDSGSTGVRTVCERKYTGKYSEASGPRIYSGWGSGYGFAPGRTGPYNFLIMPMKEAQDEVIVGFAYKPKANPGTNALILNFTDSREIFNDGQGHVLMYDNYGQQFSFYRQTTSFLLGRTGPGLLRPHRWNYVEVRVKVSNTVGQIECYINGIQACNLTGLDTDRGGSFSQMTEVHWYAMTANADSYYGAYVFDDLYILTTNAGTHTTFLGPTKIEGLYPTAEGDNIDFTPSAGTDNALNVDENPTSNTDYNSSSTSTNYDLLTMENLSLISQNVRCLQLNVDFMVTEANPYGVKPKIKSSTTEDAGATCTTSDDEESVTKHHIWDQDPATTAAWAVSAINAAQIGYELA